MSEQQRFNLTYLGQGVARVLSDQLASLVRVGQGQLLKEWNRNYMA